MFNQTNSFIEKCLIKTTTQLQKKFNVNLNSITLYEKYR